MRPHNSINQPTKSPPVRAPQLSQLLRSSIALLEGGLFLATLLILDRDEALTHPLSRPILWIALVILPIATVHVVARIHQDSNHKLISVSLYRAGSVTFALIWPLVMSVFLFPDFFSADQHIWLGVSLVILLVAGIVLVQVARYGKQTFTIRGPKWPAIMVAILIGIVSIITLLSLLG